MPVLVVQLTRFWIVALAREGKRVAYRTRRAGQIDIVTIEIQNAIGSG